MFSTQYVLLLLVHKHGLLYAFHILWESLPTPRSKKRANGTGLTPFILISAKEVTQSISLTSVSDSEIDLRLFMLLRDK